MICILVISYVLYILILTTVFPIQSSEKRTSNRNGFVCLLGGVKNRKIFKADALSLLYLHFLFVFVTIMPIVNIHTNL